MHLYAYRFDSCYRHQTLKGINILHKLRTNKEKVEKEISKKLYNFEMSHGGIRIASINILRKKDENQAGVEAINDIKLVVRII